MSEYSDEEIQALARQEATDDGYDWDTMSDDAREVVRRFVRAALGGGSHRTSVFTFAVRVMRDAFERGRAHGTAQDVAHISPGVPASIKEAFESGAADMRERAAQYVGDKIAAGTGTRDIIVEEIRALPIEPPNA